MTDCENSSDGEEFLDDCLDITRLKEFMSAYEIERLHDHIENKTQKTGNTRTPESNTKIRQTNTTMARSS